MTRSNIRYTLTLLYPLMVVGCDEPLEDGDASSTTSLADTDAVDSTGAGEDGADDRGAINGESRSGTPVDVTALIVTKPHCKANKITWKRPSSSAIACGDIAGYRVYRNDLLVAVYPTPGTPPLNDGTCPQITYTAPGNQNRNEDPIDERSTHVYSIRVVDTQGLERPATTSATVTSDFCPAGPHDLRLNMTLVTFADLVPGACASYPCLVEQPSGAPFTRAKAQTDLFAKFGPNDRPPLAWTLQQSAPNKQVNVVGEVRGWVVLPPRTSYAGCTAPYNGNTCPQSAHDQMTEDAIAVRGAMPAARIDGFQFHGLDRGGYYNGAQVRMFGDLDNGIVLRGQSLPHELGHAGLYDGVSDALPHSNALWCPGNLVVGPDLRDLSKDANGVPSACKYKDYGDTMCTMGNNYRLFHAYARWRLGLLDSTNVYTMWPAATASTIALEHLSAPSTASSVKMKLLRVPLEANVADTAYLLEYRGGAREGDYSANCPGGACYGGNPIGLGAPKGIYIRLKVRNAVDLGTSGPNPNIPFPADHQTETLMLRRELSPGNYEPLYLDTNRPTYCDPYRHVRFTLKGYMTFGGVDTANIEVVRNVTCP